MHDVTPGDSAHSSHTFTAAEFEAFAAVTGDHNPIHHDAAHAAETEFETPIVPLMMTLGPVSALIGMVLPGPGAVILGTAFRPVRAVSFDRPVHYSLRVLSVSPATGVFTCRVLAYQDREVVLDGEVRTTVRAPRPRPDETTGGRLVPAGAPRTAVVTGAAGDIGSAVARALAARGWDLALVHRGGAGELAAACERAGATVHSVTADLADPAAREAAAAKIAALEPALVVHAAAAPLTAGYREHLDVGYAALRDLADAVLDGMLLRQHGCFVLIGSQAVRSHPRGWSDYVAGKAAAESVLHGIDRHHGAHGIRSVVVEPGYVQGRYSAGVRPAGLGLLPEEVADLVAAEAADTGAPARRVWLTPDGTARFALDGVREEAPPAPRAAAAAPAGAPRTAPGPGGDGAPGGVADRVEAAARTVLGPAADVRGGGVGLTPGWDSLAQLQIVLAVEAEFGVRLPAASLTGAGRFEQLCRIVEQRAGA